MARSLRLGAAAVLAAAALALTGCSAGSPSGEAVETDSTSGELTAITVGLLPIAPAAAVQYGIDEGIFEEHGLDVTTQIAQGGAAMLPAVSTGQIDIGVGNPLSVLTAASKGVDVKVLSGYSFSLAEGDDINAVITAADSGIADWADLSGKTVSVNAVNTQGDLTIKKAVDDAGGDSSSIKFIEVAFPDALAQLDSGNVDAVWVPEPFMSKAAADPSKYAVVGFPNQTAIPGLPTMVTFASSKVAEDSALVEQWRAALADVFAAAEADPEGFAATIATFTGMPEEVAKNLRLEHFSADLDTALLSDLTDLAVEYSFIEEPASLDDIVVD